MEIKVQGLDEFESLLDNPDENFIEAMLKCIEHGITNDLKKVEVFSVKFSATAQQFSVYLTQDKWGPMLKTLLEICEKNSYSDQAIDAYLLTKKYKEAYA